MRPSFAFARRALTSLLPLAAFLLLLPGCPRRIGDGCRQNIDCAFQGDRQCDLTQFEGYCTVPECVSDGCPDQAACIEFESQSVRLARRFCMTPCEMDRDCRFGYVCQTPTVQGLSAPCPANPDPMSGAPTPSCTRLLDSMVRRPGFCVQAPSP